MKLVMMSQNKFPNTGCLDNTATGFYFRPALELKFSKKWIINLEGGGECVTRRSCTARSTTGMGSSKDWSATRAPYQFQSDDPSNNPTFYGFNQVFVPYCSGDLFLGMDTKQNERAFGLRFSGFHNLDAVISTLVSKYGLHQSDLIIYTGTSAGGIAAVATLDYFSDVIKSAALFSASTSTSLTATTAPLPKIYGAPIAGFYFDNNVVYVPRTPEDPRPVGFIKWAYQDLEKYAILWNAFVPSRCALDGNGRPWECIFASRSYPTLATPVFFIHGQTDSIVMPLHAAMPPVWDHTPPSCDVFNGPCIPVIKDFMVTWGGMMQKTEMMVMKAVGQGNRSDGMFSAACLIHTGFNHNAPMVNGMNYLEAVSEWIQTHGQSKNRMDHLHIDTCFYNTKSPMCGICPRGH